MDSFGKAWLYLSKIRSNKAKTKPGAWVKEQRMASSQKIHKGRCFTFSKGQRDNCLFSELNLSVL